MKELCVWSENGAEAGGCDRPYVTFTSKAFLISGKQIPWSIQVAKEFISKVHEPFRSSRVPLAEIFTEPSDWYRLPSSRWRRKLFLSSLVQIYNECCWATPALSLIVTLLDDYTTQDIEMIELWNRSWSTVWVFSWNPLHRWHHWLKKIFFRTSIFFILETAEAVRIRSDGYSDCSTNSKLTLVIGCVIVM